MAGYANFRALAAIAHGCDLRRLAHQLANFAASRPSAAAHEKLIRADLRNRAHAKQQCRYCGPEGISLGHNLSPGLMRGFQLSAIGFGYRQEVDCDSG